MKNFALFVILSFVISGLMACTDSSATGVDKSPKDKKADGKSAKKDSYPPAPEGIMNTDLKSLEGETFKVSDFEGDVVLINLWATWCGPCIKEMPELIAMQNKYGDKGFKVIGLNTDDETPAQIKTFAEKQNLNYKLGWADKKFIQEVFNITRLPGIPQSIIINRNGNMTGVFRGGGDKVIKQMVETVDKTMAE